MKVNNGEQVTVRINGIDYTGGYVETSSGRFLSIPRGVETPPVRAEFYLNELAHHIDDVEVNRTSGLITLRILPKEN